MLTHLGVNICLELRQMRNIDSYSNEIATNHTVNLKPKFYPLYVEK